VVIAFESGDVVGRALRSIRALRPNAEILVVDNASQRSPVRGELVDEVGAKLIVSGSNVGFSRSCNRGARAACRSYILFLNPDAELAAMPEDLDRLRNGQGVFGIVAPTPSPANEWSHGLAAEAETWRDIAGALLTPYWPRVWGRPPWALRPGGDWASGACLLVDRQEFLGLGGFDEQFFFLYEDRELGRRYRQSGLPVREAQGFECRHQSGASVEGSRRQTEVLRRYLCILGLIEYWRATWGASVAWRCGRALLLGHRALTAMSAALGAAAPRTRWANKASIERDIQSLLRSAEPIEGALQFASRVARDVLDRTGAS
jgi:N-acetylglucosaminyl-diphospho-decaprenol L-rhamnosyltransferase